ncbi:MULTISPECIES: 4-hydroxyphenylacetate permease [unclassified Serratia (in: enterobacteria)]|uniref:4-hydroxyphenylacetate permease n=1 Tax=unclassified Serratia (in: enterobacteria) TaxID=2647522 RepID=UPI000500ABD3|nr:MULTISPECIES: 4-hydroxyphenylacetate permease [unclassified Serratia (in: enterobacteria)]KFK96206.1 4-hydroxyphenylacetate permease [Serratia sp. Ag2]KFL00623.1 4-hydroxyphenylacetate permease [Serratia sp. Ag1]
MNGSPIAEPISHDPPGYSAAGSIKLNARQQAVINKLFRRLLVFLFILFVFSYLDRINIGFAGLTMGKDLGLTSTMFGLATTLFYVMYVVCGIPSNIMLGIVGARRWIAIIMVVWGVASTATMFATGPNSLYVLRMLVGIAEAGFLPGLLLYLTYWFPAYYRARANALFMIAMPVTMALGSLASGYILSMDGLLDLRGWQWLFLLEGFPSVLLGAVVWFYLDDSPAKAKWLTDDDKACLQEMMEADKLSLVQPQGSISYTALQHGSMWRELFTPVILLYTLAYFCLTNTLSALSVWTPLILQSFNQSSSNITIGFLSAVPQICTIIGMIWWSKRSDRKQERKVHTLLPYLFAAVGWMFTALGTHSLLQLLGIIMASTGAFAAMVIFWTTPDQSISLRARAIGIAVINATGMSGAALGPLLMGWLKDVTGSFNAGIYLVAGFLVLGALVISFIPMKGSRPRATP